jgi:hypothetical protein
VLAASAQSKEQYRKLLSKRKEYALGEWYQAYSAKTEARHERVDRLPEEARCRVQEFRNTVITYQPGSSRTDGGDGIISDTSMPGSRSGPGSVEPQESGCLAASEVSASGRGERETEMVPGMEESRMGRFGGNVECVRQLDHHDDYSNRKRGRNYQRKMQWQQRKKNGYCVASPH